MIRKREWERLTYIDPYKLLISLGHVWREIDLDSLPYNVAALRTNELKPFREGRQSALFCYALSLLRNSPIRFAAFEEGDIDSVAQYDGEKGLEYFPIQLKELVPERVHSVAELQSEIDKLCKYTDSADLVVAFHLNRTTRIDIAELDLSKARVKELWLFGAISPDQLEWMLMGDLLSQSPKLFQFKYPIA